MTKMTPQERMTAVLMGQTPDRVPVNPFVLGYAAQITGISLGDFYADGDKCFDAQFAAMRLHGYEQTPMYGYACIGAWEFGGKVGFPYDTAYGAPYVLDHPVKSLEDVECLEVPEFHRGNLPGAYAEADKLNRRCISLGMPAAIQIGGVFTAAASIADTTMLLKWMFREPKTVHLLLEKVTEMYLRAIDYFAAEYGPENCLPFDPTPVEANTLISGKSFGEFIFPYVLKIHQRIRQVGMQVVFMHPCADHNLNIPYYIKLREDANWEGRYVWLFGPETPIADQIAAFGATDVICGNVDPPSFQFKSYEEMVELCRLNIEEGKNAPGGFILAPGCEFPPIADPVKIMAMVDAAEQYGRYE